MHNFMLETEKFAVHVLAKNQVTQYIHLHVESFQKFLLVLW